MKALGPLGDLLQRIASPAVDWPRSVRRAHSAASHLDVKLERVVPVESLDARIDAAREALLRLQARDGYWCGELRADTTLESDAIVLWTFLGADAAPGTYSRKIQKLARHVIEQQLADGGWPIYKHGPAEISATVKAYFALKLAGHAADDPRLAAARACIARLGGIHRVNTYTKLYMALLGQYDWDGIPAIPPELVLLPMFSYVNLYAMSAWTRTIVVPLSIVWARKPVRPCPAFARLDELFPDDRRSVPLAEVAADVRRLSWTRFFLGVDETLKATNRWMPLRRLALRRAESWMLERLDGSDGLGAIYPPIVNTIVAMKALGYSMEDERLRSQIHEFERLELDRGDRMEMQPCFSPVWDTAISVHALLEASTDPSHPALERAASWLVRSEITTPGDWQRTNPSAKPGGWPFEFRNRFYADIDDTIMVLIGLRRVRPRDPSMGPALQGAIDRALAWVLAMQSRNGGWAAFDRDNDRAILTRIPFADHNAMIDPPTADITGRALELLGMLGRRPSDPVVARALAFLEREQEKDGSWYGRWSVNYIYGTWQVLRGLASVGLPPQDRMVARAAAWLLSVQRPDGGWGETCATYDDPSLKGGGPSTPAQTSWAVMGLMAAGLARHDAVARGVRWLMRSQKADGTWDEQEDTGTGFPRVFYLEYTMYRSYFPLMALGQYRRAAGRG